MITYKSNMASKAYCNVRYNREERIGKTNRKVIEHYKRKLLRRIDEPKAVLHCLKKLDLAKVTPEILMNSDVGKIVNRLKRKKNVSSEVLKKSKALVTKWKTLVRHDHEKEEIRANENNPDSYEGLDENDIPELEDIPDLFQNPPELQKDSVEHVENSSNPKPSMKLAEKCLLCNDHFVSNKAMRIHIRYSHLKPKPTKHTSHANYASYTRILTKQPRILVKKLPRQVNKLGCALCIETFPSKRLLHLHLNYKHLKHTNPVAHTKVPCNIPKSHHCVFCGDALKNSTGDEQIHRKKCSRFHELFDTKIRQCQVCGMSGIFHIVSHFKKLHPERLVGQKSQSQDDPKEPLKASQEIDSGSEKCLICFKPFEDFTDHLRANHPDVLYTHPEEDIIETEKLNYDTDEIFNDFKIEQVNCISLEEWSKM